MNLGKMTTQLAGAPVGNSFSPFNRRLPRRLPAQSCIVALSRGFTLIELLVVIAVIAILAAMLLPALAGAKAQGNSTVCKNHLHEMGLAIRMYVDDSKYYPFYDYDAGPNLVKWQQAIQPYYQLNWTNPAYHCPVYQGGVSWDDSGDFWYGSYSYNLWGAAKEGQAGLGVGANDYAYSVVTAIPPHQDTQVIAPSETYAIMDTRIAFHDALPQGYSWTGPGKSGWDWTACVPYGEGANNTIQIQHDKSFNVVFCDAHVASVRFVDLFDPEVTASDWNVDHQPHPDLW
jgi:prepilin-type N-terminal cleavage/methylation domain-containing protein/prepilin-type processing-associated H-X9-DG protein